MVGSLGGIFSLVGGLGKYAVTQSLADEQEQEAERLRNEAANVKAPALRQEFRDLEKLKALQVLTGMPGMSGYREDIELGGANTLRAGADAVSSGGEYLELAARTYQAEARAKRDLNMQDAAYRQGALNDYATTLTMIGQEQKANEAIQREERNKLLEQSSALSNAATQNKYQGRYDAIGDVSASLASIAGGIAGGAGTNATGTGAAPAPPGIVTQAPAKPINKVMNDVTMKQAAVPITATQRMSLSATDYSFIQNMMAQYGIPFEQALELFLSNRKVH